MAIDPLSVTGTGLVPAGRTMATPSASEASGGVSFGDRLGGVESADADANAAVGRMLDGSGDVHEAMIALQRADVMLQLTVQIRNKLVQAYQDVMRMSV